MKSKQDMQKDLIRLQTELQAMLGEVEEYDQTLETLLKNEAIQKAESSLYDFYIQAWDIFETVPFIGNWHLQCICEHLEAVQKGEIQDIIFEVPPRMSKSSIINIIYPVWVWLQNPQEKFITCAHSDSLAVRDAVRSRQIINSPWFTQAWGKDIILKPGSNQKSKYENTENGYRIATSIGGRGIGEGYDTLIVDDPHKPIEINSKAAIQEVTDWWTGTMTSRRNSSDSRRIVMHQRLAENDLIGYIREESDDAGWEIVSLPMEYEPTTYVSLLGWSDPRKEEGELLWPERFPKSTVNKMKSSLGSFGYSAQYQQRPVAKEGGLIKKDWIKFYNVPFNSFTARDFDILISSWDLSFSDEGDYTVGQVWGKKGPDKFLVDEVRGKWTFTEQLHQITALKNKWPTMRSILVENKANGAAVIDVLRKRLPGLIPINPKEIGGGDKEVRLSACALDFESGNVYIPSNNISVWTKDWVNELTTFPKGKYDDRVDTTSQALNWIATKVAHNTAIILDEGSEWIQKGYSPSYAKQKASQPKKIGDFSGSFVRQANTVSTIRKVFS